MKRLKDGIARFFALGLMITLIGLSGCASGISDSETPADHGDIVISLTDAEGDFISYKVDVLSLTLTKKSGAKVSTLPIQTTVDFAQYTDMTEFLTAATIPHGKYTGATMTLDYRNSDIWVEDSGGESVKVDDIKDENGDDITTLTVTVNFTDSKPVRITRGIPAHLTLDFDLKASNKVEFIEDGAPALTVEPVLLADIDPKQPKIHRLRGPLKKVNVERSEFTVIIRPFYHAISGKHERFGTLKVMTSDDTIYDINGIQYEGEDGLMAMDELTIHTGVVVIGDLKLAPHRFRAREVYAGSSVPGGNLDVVTGNVISRLEDTVILKGASLVRENGSVIFNDMVTVQLGDDTVVSRQLSTEEFGIDDISIGQRIVVFGDITNENVGSLELDAISGYARMLLTTMRGTIIDETSSIVMDLQSIDNRKADIFDFSGTGIDTEHDADPDEYEINTSTLELPSFTVNDPIQVRGFISPFGQAPYDFNAWTVIDVSEMKSFLKVGFQPSIDDPFESLSEQGMLLNPASMNRFHHVARGAVVINLKDFSGSPLIQPETDGQGHFLITYHGTAQLYPSFGSFISGIEDRMNEGQVVRSIDATGVFDQEAITLTAISIAVKMVKF